MKHRSTSELYMAMESSFCSSTMRASNCFSVLGVDGALVEPSPNHDMNEKGWACFGAGLHTHDACVGKEQQRLLRSSFEFLRERV